MNLLIRSQDREILSFIGTVEIGNLEGGYFKIKGYSYYPHDSLSINHLTLGKYKTKKRALEVIDEIETLLLDHWRIFEKLNELKQKVDEIVSSKPLTFYQMPDK